MKAAGELETASDARFQCTLPFDAVDRSRLARLRTERIEARRTSNAGIGVYADRRRHAQLAARHALQQIAAQLASRQLAPTHVPHPTHLAHPTHPTHATFENLARVAELQLPEAWLPFVMAR